MRKYLFGHRFDDVIKSPMHFRTPDKARWFLEKAVTEYNTLSDLRTWAHRWGAAVRTDEELLDFAAISLVSGSLIVGEVDKTPGKTPELRVMKGGGEGKPPPPRKVAPAPLAPGERTTPSEMREPKPEPKAESAPAPAPEMDTDQQVAALLAAAKSGAPFCEQCAQAAANE